MSIPAARIKQLRAIFAKSKRTLRKVYGGSVVDGPSIGEGWISAHVAARKKIARQLRIARSGEKPILPLRRGWKNEDVRLQLNPPERYARPDYHHINVIETIASKSNRDSAKKIYRHMKKIKRGDA